MPVTEPARHPDAPSRATDASGRATGVIVVGMSIAVWWPAFTLGAWGEPFFDQLLTVWAAATGAFFVVLIQRGQGLKRFWRAAALLVPTLWLVLSVTVTPDDSNLANAIVTLLAVLVGLLGIPVTIYTLARIIWPEFGHDISRRLRLYVVLAVALIAVGSFQLGVHESSFLTCEDFAISGNSLPPGLRARKPLSVGSPHRSARLIAKWVSLSLRNGSV